MTSFLQQYLTEAIKCKNQIVICILFLQKPNQTYKLLHTDIHMYYYGTDTLHDQKNFIKFKLLYRKKNKNKQTWDTNIGLYGKTMQDSEIPNSTPKYNLPN